MSVRRLALNAGLVLLLILGNQLFWLALIPTHPAAAQSGSIWPQLAGGPAHLGFTDDAAFADLPQSEGELQLKWKFALEERVEITAQPIVADGRVYLGLMDGRVLALDAISGRSLWTRTIGGAVPNTLAYAGGRIYFGAEDGIVYALNAADGTELWRYPTGGPVYSSAAVVDDMVYVGSTDGYLYALSGSDGSLHWRFQATGPVLTSPAVGGGHVYFGAEDASADPSMPYPVAYALDISGDLVWSRILTGLSLRHTYPILDELSDAVIFSTLHPGYRSYGPDYDWPFQDPCVSPESETSDNLVAGWDSYYQTYPEHRALFFLRASDGSDKWSPASHRFPALPPSPYWGVILPLVDDQHRAWFPTVGACNAVGGKDFRLWRVNLFTGQAEQVAMQSQFTLRPDEVGRPTLVGNGSDYRYYNAIDADLGVYAPGVGQWYLFGQNGFWDHNYPLDFPPTLHFLRYAGSWIAGNVPSAGQPVIADGVLYWTTFGWLYAVEPGNGDHGDPQLPRDDPPNPANPPVPEPLPPIPPGLGDGSPTAVRAALNAQVAELIAHGRPTPSAKLYGWIPAAVYPYWQPAETLYALAQALPYLDEPLRHQTVVYLKAQADALLYNPDEYQYQRRCLVYGSPGVQIGEATCSSNTRAAWWQNDPNLIAWGLVAMREVARQTGDWSAVQSHWEFIEQQFYADPVGLGSQFDERLGFSVFEGWLVDNRLSLHLQIMAADAVAQMADHAGDAATRDRALSMKTQMFAARLRHGRYAQAAYESGELDPLPYPVALDGSFDVPLYFDIAHSLMPYEVEINRDTDVRQVMWEDENGIVYGPTGDYRNWAEMYAYRPLNQDIADWLQANLLNETVRYLRALEFRNPWWFWGESAHDLMGRGEELYASPHLSFSIFQVEARVMRGDALFGNQPRHNYDWLVRHLPWAYGQPAWRDVYRLQNLIALLEIAGGPDLSLTAKSASAPAPRFGQAVTYTIAIRNDGGPLTRTARLTDTVPAGLSYIPDTLVATSGICDDGAAPTLRWSGALSNTDEVIVTYAVTVTETSIRCIPNTVTIDAGPEVGVFTWVNRVIANGYTVYLPVILKGLRLP